MAIALSPTNGSVVENYTFNTINTTYDICIYPTWTSYLTSGVIQYNATGYMDEYYFIATTLGNVSQTTNLYLLDSTLAKTATIYVIGSDGTPYANGYVDIQRYYPTSFSYITVSQIKTDDDGKAVANIIPNTVYYRFIVKDSDGNAVGSFLSRIITCSASDYTCPPYTVTLDLSTGTTTDWFSYNDNSVSCTNTTTSISCTVVDSSSSFINSSLRVNNLTQNSIVCIQNVTPASGTLTCTIGDMTNRTYQYYVYAYTDSGWVLLYLDYLEGPKSVGETMPWGEWGIFLLIGLNVIFFAIGNWVPYVPNVIAIVLNYMLYQVGIFNVTLPAMAAFICIQLTVIWIMSKVKT
jgi:hypothetical protein